MGNALSEFMTHLCPPHYGHFLIGSCVYTVQYLLLSLYKKNKKGKGSIDTYMYLSVHC
jgi:hypothetical protein